MSSRVYVHAAMMPVGLGNMLFPWARAEVLAHQHGLPMLSPRWTLPKAGPLLRWEKDKRFYVGLFSGRGYVRGLRRRMVLWRAERVNESEAPAALARGGGGGGRGGGGGGVSGRPIVIECRGHEGWFAGQSAGQDLRPHRELVTRRLHEILSEPIRRRLAAQDGDFVIAAHVRRGDKPTMKFMEPWAGVTADGIPRHHCTMADEWFVNTIRSVRGALGWAAPVRVFSDARDEQIAPILALEGVTRAPDNPSIVDMLMLAKARVLITTGTSSFSAWGAYLGGMPAVWYPGLRLEVVPGRPELAVETDLEGGLAAGAGEVLRQAAGMSGRSAMERGR